MARRMPNSSLGSVMPQVNRGLGSAAGPRHAIGPWERSANMARSRSPFYAWTSCAFTRRVIGEETLSSTSAFKFRHSVPVGHH